MPQRARDPLAALRVGKLRLAQAERDVALDREPRDRSVLLEHDADAVGHAAVDRLALEVDRALGRDGEPRDQLEQGRLAAARRPDHGEELALAQVEIERPERVDTGTAGGGGKHLDHIAKPRMDRGRRLT